MKTIVQNYSKTRFAIKSDCKSTLGKRKAASVSEGHESEISLNVSAAAKKPYADYKLSANCWLKDSEERQLAIVLDHSTLISLHAELDQMIRYLEENGGLYQEPVE